MHNKRITIGIITTIWICLMAQIVTAEDEEAEEQNNLAMVYFVNVKDGHEEAFLEAITEHAQWRRDAEDPWTWHVYQVVVGENLGQYIIRSGEHAWCDFDSYGKVNVVASAEWNKNVGPHCAKITNLITATDTKVVNWLPEGENFNLLSIVSYDLKPGRSQDFSKAITQYHETIMEHGYDTHYSFAWSVRGGSGEADVHLVLPSANYADMAGPEEELQAFIARVLGEEEARKLGEQFSGSVRSSDSYIVRFIPELSILHGE